MSEVTRSVLFNLDADEKVSDQQIKSASIQETRIGKWTQPLYICARRELCEQAERCSHAKPHKEKPVCFRRWRDIIGLQEVNSIDMNTTSSESRDRWIAIPREEDELMLRPLELTGWWNAVHTGYVNRGGHYCANCVGVPGSRVFVPLKRAALAEKNTKVICPGAIASCIGRCAHAEPHAKNGFCKDKFKDDSIHLQCRPIGSHKHGGGRGLLFDIPKLPCHV